MTAPLPLVLLVEDELPIRKFLGASLASSGYRLEEAGTGHEALKQASQSPPDLVILDLGLPDMDGQDVLRQLREWTQARRTNPSLALRARIVVACGRDAANTKVARQLKVSAQTVGKWRARFISRRLQGLTDEPRSGAPRSISDELVEAVLAKTLHETPPGTARWSSRQLASALGISQRAVLRIWRAFEL